jgi:hypothetical protein
VCVCVCVCVWVCPPIISSIGFRYYYKCDILLLEKISTWCTAQQLLGLLGSGYVFTYCASLRWVQEICFCDYKNID